MTLIVDPDLIPQGAITTSTTAGFSAKSGDTITISGTADLPAVAANDIFEVRDAPTAANNGLYQESGGSPTTSQIIADKVDGVPPQNDAGPDTIRFFGNTTTEKVVFWNTNTRRVRLLVQDTVVFADGIDGRALFSKAKDDWNNDDDLNNIPFPFQAIDFDAGKYYIGTDEVDPNGWSFEDDTTRQLLRNAGYAEINGDGYNGTSPNGSIVRRWANFSTLDNFEDDTADTAYGVYGDDPATAGNDFDMAFPGPVNEMHKSYDLIVPPDTGTGVAITGQNTVTRNDGGSFLTDGFIVGGKFLIQDAEDAGNNGTWGPIDTLSATVITVTGTPLTNNAADTTMRIAFDNREKFRLFCRVRDADPQGKTYVYADLVLINKTTLVDGINTFSLGTDSDFKITETDANIGSNTPYTEIRTRYLAATYNREVDTTTKRDFGIVVDCGTYSQSNGAAATTSRWDSASLNLGAGEALADYAGGTLIVHEGVNQGSYTISGTPVDNASTLEVTLVGTPLTVSGSSESFTVQRATPLNPTEVEIHEKLQYDRRQDADVDSTASAVIGKISDQLSIFIGDDIDYGSLAPVNPNGGGSGVIVEGFSPNATNLSEFFDNGGTGRTFPFVSAGTFEISQTFIDDTVDRLTMYFEYTERFTNTGFGISAPTGDTATLDSSTTDLVAELALGDFIELAGFADAALNGTYVLTGTPAGAGPWTAAVRKLDQQTLVVEAAGASVSLDKNPYKSDDAIIVNDNAGSPIDFAPSSTPVAWTFDYDGNTQGGRAASTDAAVVVVAVGSDKAKYVRVFTTIGQETGKVIQVVGGSELNYNNP